jgi:hypothetical protein
MGLGWVINMPAANHPLILQKSGGLQGNFAYLAIAPTLAVGAFFCHERIQDRWLLTAAVAATNALPTRATLSQYPRAVSYAYRRCPWFGFAADLGPFTTTADPAQAAVPIT